MADSIMSSKYTHSRMPSVGSSTAYTGADGHIDILSLDDEAFADKNRSRSPSRERQAIRPTAQQTAAAALTRSKSILHSRAKSLAAWTSNSISSISEKPVTTNKIFGDLFSGESAPIRLGLPPSSPIKEEEETEFVMEYRPAFTQRSSFATRRQSATSTIPPQQMSAKQGWLSRRLTGMPVNTKPQTVYNDELLDMNINNSLFPDGPADPLSPTAFNDLLLNATRLLERMQTSYREKVDYIASIQPEIDAQREEAEEAETRAQHLKMQLEDMGRQAQEHDNAMRQMSIQLAEEKIRAQEARESANSIRVVSDDDTTPRRRKRGSAGSASDSGFESDWDRDTESVVSSGIPTPRTPPAIMTAPSTLFGQLDRKIHKQAPFRPSNLGNGPRVNTNEAVISLNVLHQLRNENQDLRQQVDDMQHALQGCIEYVDDLKA